MLRCISFALFFKSSYPIKVCECYQTHCIEGNLQYDTLGCWLAGTIVSLSKHLLFQVLLFFHNFCKILCKNCFNSFRIYKKKLKSFDCPKSIRNYKKNNAWNIRRLLLLAWCYLACKHLTISNC